MLSVTDQRSCSLLSCVFSQPASGKLILSSRLRGKGENLGVLLRFQYQLGGQKSLLLILRSVGPIHNIGHQLRPERQRHVAAIDVTGLFMIYDK